jgi:hypothetical protein
MSGGSARNVDAEWKAAPRLPEPSRDALEGRRVAREAARHQYLELSFDFTHAGTREYVCNAPEVTGGTRRLL